MSTPDAATPRVAAIQGPYTYNPITGNVDGPNGVIIARVHRAGLTEAQQDATGLLMAASWELLALLKLLVPCADMPAVDAVYLVDKIAADAEVLVARIEGVTQ